MASDRKLTRPYHHGSAGACSVMSAEIVKGAAAKRQLIGTIPAGAVILDRFIDVLEAFNAGTSNLLTMGYGAIAASTADDLLGASDVTEGTPGVYPSTRPQALSPLPSAVDVYVYYTPGDDQASTGIARAYVHYARMADNG